MRTTREIRQIAAWTVATITLVTSILALIALNAGGEVAIGPLALMKLAAGYDRRAQSLMSGSDLLKRASRREAADLSQKAISQYPYDTSAWLRIAYADMLDQGTLTASGLSALKTSYDLVAIDAFVGLWRVRFALENSQSLSPELRASVRNEAFALWRNSENRRLLIDMSHQLQNPAGRLSLSLWLIRLQSGVAK